MRKVKNIVLLVLVAFAGCQQSNIEKYKTLVKTELASNKKVDDIFFGVKLGMLSKDFYLHCWNMNKQGVFTDGTNNTMVLYKLDDKELSHPASLNFYPEFHEGRIHKLEARFQYDGWMPWNKKLGSDSLLNDVVKLYQKWYPTGNEFIKITDEKRGTIYVKVDGNRRIILGRYDDVDVKADYTDLSVKEEEQNK